MSGGERRGFTLVELLVVILIILLISVATLPIVLPALRHRQVSEGARILQAQLVAARDAAVKAQAPRGIRLVLDYQFHTAPTFAASQIIPIEPGPDYSAGLVNPLTPSTDPSNASGANGPAYDPADPRIGFQETKFLAPGIPAEPTTWFWNLRQGDRIRLGDSGRYYTIAGPCAVGVIDAITKRLTNTDRFINYGYPLDYSSLPINTKREFLFVVNGQDDDGDGWADESFDGIDNDGDGITDPGFNGIDDDGDGNVDNWQELFINYNPNLVIVDPVTGQSHPVGPVSGEYEPEAFVGPQLTAASFTAKKYTVLRRPVPTQGARAVALPSDVVIDLTTLVPTVVGSTAYPATRERSRLPMDPNTGYIDLLIAPSGQVLNAGPTASIAPTTNLPVYQFWLAERSDVHEPILQTGLSYQLPMPSGTPGYVSQGDRDLKGERRLVTLFLRTGRIVTSEPQTFNGADPSAPFYESQGGQPNGR